MYLQNELNIHGLAALSADNCFMCFQLARLMSSNAPWDGVYQLTLSVMDLLTAQIFPMKCRVVVSKE